MPPGLILTVAILTEVTATVALRLSNGFTRPVPSIVVVVGYGLSFFLLSQVLRHLSIGYTYAVWSAAGTALIAVVGVVAWGESATLLKVVSLALIITGVVGLNLTSSH